MEIAIFGAGCFWGVEAAFMKIKGVISTTVGYMGGDLENPTYEDVCTNKTGHVEVVKVEFDSSVISYENTARHHLHFHPGCRYCPGPGGYHLYPALHRAG